MSTFVDDWVVAASMVRLGASVEELAADTIQEIMGYRTRKPGQTQGMPQGHKPPRADIQKMKDVYDLYERGGWRELGAGPHATEGLDQKAEVDQARTEWNERYELNGREEKIVELYQHVLNTQRQRHDLTPELAQYAFDYVVRGLTTTGGFIGHEQDAKRFVGQVLKKYEQQHWPMLYQSIKDALDDVYRRGPLESYKLWPRMVQWIKDEFQTWLQTTENAVNRPSNSINFNGHVRHIEDVVTEGGAVLNKLRQENRLPQNFDVNRVSFKDFEDWFMQWKKDNREAEAQGEVVYEFKDGWTIQKLTTPEQLQFEGDEMGHSFHPETVIGSNLPRPISEIEEGQYVWDQNGDRKRVTGNLSHPYKGRMFSIKTAHSLPLKVTPEHLILVLQANRDQSGTPLKLIEPRLREQKPAWIHARDIREGDYLLTPRIQIASDDKPAMRHTWYVQWKPGAKEGLTRVWNDYIISPVREISTFNYDGLVYDINVEDSHSFLASGCVVHNCVGGYSHRVGEGSDIIYSLRDPKGMPHVTMEIEALEGPRAIFDPETDEEPEDAIYNHEYIHPERDNPGDHLEQKPGINAQGYRRTGETPFGVVQVQGNSNSTPKPEYQRKIREFLDYLRSKGWKFERSENWYAPHDDPMRNGEDMEWQRDTGRYGTSYAQQLDDWYDNSYKANHERWRGVNSEDAYGLSSDRPNIDAPEWSQIFESALASLVDEYDPGRWRGHWEDLAQAVFHAWMLDVRNENPTPEQLKKEADDLVAEVMSGEETLQEWEDNQWYYSQESVQDELAEKAQELAEKTPEWPKIEEALNEEYGEDAWDEKEVLQYIEDNQAEYEDLYYEASGAVREENLKYYSGDAWKFCSYLIFLAEKYGAKAPKDLPNPNDRHGGLPSYEELEKMPWPSQQQSEVEKGLPGAMSKVADLTDWYSLPHEDPANPKLAGDDIQIYPIDQEHNVWLDEDGNQHERWRPGWARDESGKMRQIGELEDTFLDKQGRQGEGWVAYHGDRPIGSLTYVDTPVSNMIGTAYVHPDYREQGLFNRMVAPLRETGKPIDAYVWNNPWLRDKVRSWPNNQI